VPLDGYLKHTGSFYRAPEALVHQRVELRFDRDFVWVDHPGQVVARYPRSYVAGTWRPAPRMRPEPPQIAPLVPIAAPQVVPPALSDYAELCA
jgi:hypothetical protein